jgi:hypothetical protein
MRKVNHLKKKGNIMWKKLMTGIIIGVMFMTVSTGVIYGAQINPASSATSSTVALAGNGKGDGNGSSQNASGDCDDNGLCDETGDCVNQDGTVNGAGVGDCTNENCTGDCDGSGICDGTGDCVNQDGTVNGAGIGDCTNENCTGDCDSPNCPDLQNGQQQNSIVNGVGAENKKAGLGYTASNKNKNVERYEETNIFRNAFARFLSFFKFGNNS